MGAKVRGEGQAAYVADRLAAAEARRTPRSPRDPTAREQAEREVAAHVAVAEALAAWDGVDSGFARLLAGLGESLEFEVAVLWVPRGDRLRPRAFWQAAAGDSGEFKAMTLTSRLPPGRELPGQAWQQLAPTSRAGADGPGPPRWRAAVKAGFREAIAFPAMSAGEVIAVIELVSREQPELSERLKRSLAAIGYVLGIFLAHRRGILDEQLITQRQVEILTLAAQGLSRDQIAERLGVSPSTVKTHFENSYARLGVKTRAQAVAQAIRLGLVR
jgi:DNA-binding CsgD family transcriptional regulator